MSSARYPIVLAITGASGAPYAVRLLQQLVEQQVPTWLIVSNHGFRLLATESHRRFRQLSAVTSGVKDLREVLAKDE